eukprot:4291-Pelagococcus_subviridis.AAC.2
MVSQKIARAGVRGSTAFISASAATCTAVNVYTYSRATVMYFRTKVRKYLRMLFAGRPYGRARTTLYRCTCTRVIVIPYFVRSYLRIRVALHYSTFT